MERAKKIVKTAVHALNDKKAEDIKVIDISKVSAVADYFIIITATSVPHLKALVGHLEETVRKELGRRALTVDGEPASEWVLIDFGSVLVHIMSAEARAKYELERLWSDAPRLEIAG